MGVYIQVYTYCMQVYMPPIYKYTVGMEKYSNLKVANGGTVVR